MASLPFEIKIDGLGSKPGISLEVQITKDIPKDFIRKRHPDARGLFEWTKGHIWVERDTDWRMIRRTLLHEVLHAALNSEEIADELDMPPAKEEILCERLDLILSDYLENPQVQELYRVGTWPVIKPRKAKEK